MRSIAIIFNQRSGILSRLEELQKNCIELSNELYHIEIYEVQEGDNIPEIAKHYIARKFDTIAAAGGDGTVNAVGCALINTQCRLGILPLGTFNHLAKDLGISTDLSLAFRTLTNEGKEIIIDAASCNKTIFFNNSSLGIYPKVVHLREKYQSWGKLKWTAFFFAVIEVITRLPNIFISFEAGGRKISRRTPFLFVGNNAYKLTGVGLGTRSSLSSGNLSVWLIHSTSFGGMLGLLRIMLSVIVKEDRELDTFYPQEVIIETVPSRLSVSYDGEVLEADSPFHYKILPQCLRVIVPEKI